MSPKSDLFPAAAPPAPPPKAAVPLSECLKHETAAQEDDRDGFFASPGFLRAFEQVFGDRATVEVLTLTAPHGPDARLPVMRCRVWRRPGLAPRYDYLAKDARYVLGLGRTPFPLRQISPVLGLGAAQLRFSALRGALGGALGDPTQFWAQAAAELRRQPGWDIGVFPLPEDEIATAAQAFGSLGCAAFVRPLNRTYFTLETPAPLDQILARQSGKFRQNIRRAQALADKEQIKISCHRGAAARTLMPRLAQLADLSWKAQGRQTANARGQSVLVPFAGEQQRFFDALSKAPGLTPVMTLAAGVSHDEAACLSFRHGGTHVTSLIFQRPRSGAASYGRLVMQAQIDHAIRSGARRIDYNSSAPWVRPYADTQTRYDNLLVIRPGLRGAVLTRLAQMKGGGAHVA
ncbi:MAG: GNAT family N-acetyltransferase [Pelagimonas sp.]|jgi:hypothetical protein|nr:GNAT family N-acetyltransferase [Pelagimonas sp.]